MWGKQKQTIVVSAGFDLAMARSLNAARQVYQGASYDRNTGEVQGSNGFSLMSYGDRLKISALSTSPEATELQIESNSVLSFFDFGHSAKLVKKVLAEIEELSTNVVDVRDPVISLEATGIDFIGTPIR